MSESNKTDTSLDETYSAAWSDLGEGVGIDDDSLPSAADFLASHPDASLAERLEVLLADQMLRWRRGCPKLIGDYLAEHPTSTGEPETILKLIQGEFLALLETHQNPDPAAYARMFPELSQEIHTQCEVDRWLSNPLEPTLLLPANADHAAIDAEGDATAAQLSDVAGQIPGARRHRRLSTTHHCGKPTSSGRACSALAAWGRFTKLFRKACATCGAQADQARCARFAVAGTAILCRGAGSGPAAPSSHRGRARHRPYD